MNEDLNYFDKNKGLDKKPGRCYTGGEQLFYHCLAILTTLTILSQFLTSSDVRLNAVSQVAPY